MKTLLLRSLLVFLIFASPTLMAQAPLQTFFSPNGQSVLFSEPELNAMPIDTPLSSLAIRNIVDQDSQLIRGKVWVSVDAVFSEFDNPVEGEEFTLLACPDPSDTRTCFIRTAARSVAKLPLPGVTLAPEEQLPGHNLTTSGWMGETLFFEACYSLNGGLFDQGCRRIDVIVGPQKPSAIASDGTRPDGILLEWNFAEHENGSSLADSFRILKTRTDSIGGTETLDFLLADVPSTIVGVGADRKYQIFDDNVEPGVGYRYQVKNCTSVSGSEVCTEYDFSRVRETGNRFATFNASAGTRTDGVLIEWRQYSTFNLGYRVRRCAADGITGCVDLETRLNALSYLDTSVQPGESYIYEIFSCEGYNSTTNPDLCTSGAAPMGASNIAFVGVAPDAFEDDSSPAQAAVIDINSLTPLERNFDGVGDVDWLQFTLNEESDISIGVISPQSAAIGIALFDSNGVQVGVQSSNLFQTGGLVPGQYFIRLLPPDVLPFVPILYDARLSAEAVVQPDQYEVDNAPNTAKIITASETQSRTFHQDGDIDWIRFTLGSLSNIEINTSNGLLADIEIELFDESLTPIAGPQLSSLSVLELAEGSYFMLLSDETVRGSKISGSSTGGGTVDGVPYQVALLVETIIRPDQFEDDNVAARAKEIIANAAQAQDHTLHVEGDVDWMRFSLDEVSNISIDTFFNANTNLQIELYDTALGLIGSTTGSRLQEMELDEGNYFIRVSDANDGGFEALAYSIALSAEVVDPPGGIQPDKYENDDTSRRAQRINRPVTQTRSFHEADNDDWIRIVLDKPQSITIATRGTNLADTQIFLYDSELQRLGYSANTPGVATSHARLKTDTLAAGEYYALINQIDGRPEGFAFLAIERYVLTVDMQPSDRKVNISAIVELLLDD